MVGAVVRFGWRDYDPDTGRWTAQDPIGDAGGDTDWYGYCLDDPINGVDPAGLFDINAGDIISNGLTLGMEAAKQAKMIPSSAANTIGYVLAPLGDMISPKKANEGEDLLLWRKEAVENDYYDIFDTESERTQRILEGKGERWRKKD